MSVTRDFDAMLAEKAGERPMFKVAGQSFTLRSKLPFGKWEELMAGMRGENPDMGKTMAKFFETVLIKADRQRFKDLLAYDGDDDDDDEGVIDMAQLDAITEWAMEYFTGKLQSSTAGSSPGAPTTGASRKVVSLNARTTAS